MSSPLDKVLQDYYKEGTHQRLGQYFVNTYIKKVDKSTELLFNERDFNKARQKISQFLMNNHWDRLPKKLINQQATASRFL